MAMHFGTGQTACRVSGDFYVLFHARYREVADPCVFYAAGSMFQLETQPSRMGQADGELIGLGPFVVTVEPLAARVLVPRRGGG